MIANAIEPRRRGRPPKQDSDKVLTVQALERGLKLLEILADNNGVVLTDLAIQANMAPSTAHRFLVTLQQNEFVRFDPATHRWSVGVKIFELGQAFTRNRDVVSVSRPKMDELMSRSGETISLALADDEQIIFVAQVETPSSIRAFFPPGERGPLHASGCGKAILATWPDARIAETIARVGMPVFTPNTLRTLPDLLGAAAEARALGWTVNDGEHTAGMRCVAAPIFGPNGRAIAAMSISGPVDRVPPERLPELGVLLRDAVVEITAAIGGRTDFFRPQRADAATMPAGAQG